MIANTTGQPNDAKLRKRVRAIVNKHFIPTDPEGRRLTTEILELLAAERNEAEYNARKLGRIFGRKRALDQVESEVIGEDEGTKYPHVRDRDEQTRNKLRTEQRQKLQELRERE